MIPTSDTTQAHTTAQPPTAAAQATPAKPRLKRLTRAHAQLLRKLILDVVAAGPCNWRHIAETINATEGGVRHQLYWLVDLGLITFSGKGSGDLYSVTEHYHAQQAEEAQRKAAQLETPPAPSEPVDAVPVVQVYTNPAWMLPTPEVTVVDGVRITRAPAAPPRFAVDLRPGTGVISLDNPGLARLAKLPITARRGRACTTSRSAACR